MCGGLGTCCRSICWCICGSVSALKGCSLLYLALAQVSTSHAITLQHTVRGGVGPGSKLIQGCLSLIGHLRLYTTWGAVQGYAMAVSICPSATVTTQRLVPNKWDDYLMNMINAVRAETPDHQWAMGGCHSDLGEILSYIKRRGRSYQRHTLGEILREITKDPHHGHGSTYKLQYVGNLSKNR
jgi:hypothetical protein